ncbi:MAG: hypothetical protein WB565_07785 [Acidimicrobiales bacterium]
MELVELVRMNAFDLGDHGVSVEFGILAFAGVLVLALLVAKARRAYLQKMRRASSAGYYDYDVARYGGAAPGRSLIEATETSGPQSLASTFSAPTGGSRKKDRSSATVPPVPGPPAPHSPSTEFTFGSAPPPPGSAPLPPPPGSGSAPLPPPPPAPGSVSTEDAESGGSGLPLLVPPPPPPSRIPPPPRG